MELSNRFDLLASFSADEESKKSVSRDIRVAEPEEKDEEPTKNPWEIPEYVEKSIPCLIPLTTKEETSKSTAKVKTSRHVKKMKALIDYSKDEEEANIAETLPTEEVHTLPITYSQYPPQPYKFKSSAANHRQETMPKFNRKNNVVPKHTSVRGNSKSCTHQI